MWRGLYKDIGKLNIQILNLKYLDFSFFTYRKFVLKIAYQNFF